MFLTSRKDFEEEVSRRFPKFRRTRKETGRGWRDTMEVSFLRVEFEVCDTKSRPRNRSDVPFGHLRVRLLAVREGLDGSRALVWLKQEEGWDGAMRLLDETRARLLGLAHALVSGTGSSVALSPPEAPEESEISLTQDILDLLS